jgi:predicted short-subunit dehydrogenase-like oxidoreductase (DUF2520 family)
MHFPLIFCGPVKSRGSIAIIGPGRLGSALAVSLHQAGYLIPELVSSGKPNSRRTARKLAKKLGAKSRDLRHAALNAEVIWFCVPDARIASVASSLADRIVWKGKIALHSSGALASDELDVLRRRGASVGSAHPLMTFVHRSRPSLAGVSFAMEGDVGAMRTARKIVRALDAASFAIPRSSKAAYHAWGAFLSPLLVSMMVTAERVAINAGLSVRAARRMMRPIVERTLLNYETLGPKDSFSGPLVRGDAETVRKHLHVLRKIPHARRVYQVLAQSALLYLATRNREELKEIVADQLSSSVRAKHRRKPGAVR